MDSADEDSGGGENTTRNRKKNIIDSDSDEEGGEDKTLKEAAEVSTNEQFKSTRYNLLDSDLETEGSKDNETPQCTDNGQNIEEEVADEEVSTNKPFKSRRYHLLDSDSKTEDSKNVIETPQPIDNSQNIAEENTPHEDEQPAAEAAIFTADNKGNLVPETTEVKKSGRYSLYDSESSEDETARESHPEQSESTFDESIKPVRYRKAKKSTSARPQRMSVKEAMQQKVEIQSESQRRVRESSFCLPYHKPKTYSIKEFLQKRSKLASTIPLVSNEPPSLALKMSKDQLQEVSKKLDERVKEVEQFYKSDSEDEEKGEQDELFDEFKSWIGELVDNAMETVDKATEPMQVDDEPEDEEPMEYEFNLNDEQNAKPSKLMHIQPKLSGQPDQMIDLDDDEEKASEMKKFVERILQNTTKKTLPKHHKVNLDVVGVGTHGEIVKETVSVDVDEEETPALHETPGAKLQKLREDLVTQIAQKRLELWKQKQQQGDLLDNENQVEEKEKDILDDDEEEFEMTESESEDEEEYDPRPEKPKTKSQFLDEEAEEEDAEEAEEEDEKESPESEEEYVDHEDLTSPRRRLRRIIKPFIADSDEEEEDTSRISQTSIIKAADDDFIIPPNLPKTTETPQRPITQKSSTEFDFLTPVSYLTGLQNLESASKDKETTPSRAPSDSTLSLDSQESPTSVQKELFPKSSDMLEESQTTIEDLVPFCSGVFTKSQDLPSTQDLLNVCSGDFSTAPSTSAHTEEMITLSTKDDEEIKNLDKESDAIISQLLDEEELERFKKKFESPINNHARKSIQEEAQEVNATGTINSDDETDDLEVKRMKRRTIVFSDDEEEKSGEGGSEMEEEDEIEEEVKEVNDSEDEEQQLENEIAEKESSNFKITDFVDDEAELSESEWGSEDEDEKDLDVLEVEQGDEETFNEKKVRSELERIHMRELLDQDNREVKILQELLLEDGELHGSGRKRQFKWKTLDSMDDSAFEKRPDDEIFLDEDEENEEQWRRARFKREVFLKKKSQSTENDDILSDSQILKLGQQICKTATPSSTPPVVSKAGDEVKEVFNFASKRGSFLSRSDQVLQRLAEYNKASTVTTNTVKNSKSFVFQSVEVTEMAIKENSSKRKASESTPNNIKKLRLDILSPADGKPKAKTSRAKKLFGKW